jgi:hypothetical protein
MPNNCVYMWPNLKNSFISQMKSLFKREPSLGNGFKIVANTDLARGILIVSCGPYTYQIPFPTSMALDYDKYVSENILNRLNEYGVSGFGDMTWRKLPDNLKHYLPWSDISVRITNEEVKLFAPVCSEVIPNARHILTGLGLPFVEKYSGFGGKICYLDGTFKD